MPRDAPELPSTANDRRQQQPANTKLARALNPRATHGNTLVMRSSAAPLPVLGPGGWVKAEVSHPVTRRPLRCGPARGPAGWIIPGPREPSERRGVLSVQLARLPHGSVLMVKRQSDWPQAAEHARYAPRSAQRCRFGPAQSADDRSLAPWAIRAELGARGRVQPQLDHLPQVLDNLPQVVAGLGAYAVMDRIR